MKSETIKRYFPKFLILLAFSVVCSAYGVWILSFINERILTLTTTNLGVLAGFVALLVGYFIITMTSKFTMSSISNGLVYELRTRLMLRVLGTNAIKVKNIGKGKILASLSKDISSVTNGFMRLSDCFQSGLFVLFSLFYFLYLSRPIGLFVIAWFGITALVIKVLTKKTYTYFRASRVNEDALYNNYEMGLDAHKELSINQSRLKFYLDNFLYNAKFQRKTTTKAEIYHSMGTNFLNDMLLGGIGIIMYLSLGMGLADFKTATTISFALLFLRTPFMMLIGSLPAIMIAYISLKKIDELELIEYEKVELEKSVMPLSWQKLSLKNISFSYDDREILKGLNLEIKKGETTFLIGENGSGKSTLFMILCGILRPSSGEIWIDDVKLDSSNLANFQSTISVIFSDFYLFKEILNSSDKDLDFWLEKLKLKSRVSVLERENFKEFKSINLSTGQKKRVALIIALLENRDFLMLDEWAADQDPEFRAYFYDEILGVLKSRGVSVFAISHDDRYFKSADKIYEMKSGVIEKVK